MVTHSCVLMALSNLSITNLAAHQTYCMEMGHLTPSSLETMITITKTASEFVETLQVFRYQYADDPYF